MIHLNPNHLTPRENYKLLIGSIIPRPVAVITTQSEEKLLNIAPFSFFNIVSSEPAIVSVSVQRKDGKMKDTARNLFATKEAVVHILDSEIVQEANKTAALLPPEKSELEISEFTTVSSESVAVLGLKEAKIRFETTIYQHVPIKKDDVVTADLFLLEIKRYHINEEIYNDGKINPRKLDAISRLAGNSYADIGNIFDIQRPQ